MSGNAEESKGPRVGNIIDIAPLEEEQKAGHVNGNEHLVTEVAAGKSQKTRLMSAEGIDGETDEFLKSAGKDAVSELPPAELPHIGSKPSLPAKDSF